MVTKSSLILLTAVATAMATAGVANAAIISSTATLTEGSAPSGTVIATSLPASGITASGGSFNYYTGTQTSPMPGETFTTGATAASITNVVVNLADVGNAGANSPLYLYVGTGSGTTAFTGDIYEYSAAEPSTGYSNGGYLDFTLAAPLTVSANTQYDYVVSSNAYNVNGGTGNSGTYMGLGLVTTGGTASQQAGLFNIDSGYNSPTANSAYTTGGTGAYNAAFEVLGTTSAVPEPATLGLLGVGCLGLLLLRKRPSVA